MRMKSQITILEDSNRNLLVFFNMALTMLHKGLLDPVKKFPAFMEHQFYHSIYKSPLYNCFHPVELKPYPHLDICHFFSAIHVNISSYLFLDLPVILFLVVY